MPKSMDFIQTLLMYGKLWLRSPCSLLKNLERAEHEGVSQKACPNNSCPRKNKKEGHLWIIMGAKKFEQNNTRIVKADVIFF
jgi:hypothetical protein